MQFRLAHGIPIPQHATKSADIDSIRAALVLVIHLQQLIDVIFST